MMRNTGTSGANGAAGASDRGDDDTRDRALGDDAPCDDAPGDDAPGGDSLREIARAAARCFGTDDGRKLLAHLRAITIERACGPQVSDAALRDLEGQRRLVRRLCALIDRGRRGDRPIPIGDNYDRIYRTSC